MEENKIKNENILSDSNQSLICHLTDIYPNNFNAIEDVHIPRYDEISKRFSKIYGISIQYFIRVPGIINLIGDPVKLYGYTPISFALDQDIVFAFAINDKNTLNITNSQSALYPKITISNEISQKFDEENAYLNLLLAGYKAALQDSFVSVPKGISLFISSNLPTKNGNFSSSALILGMYCTALIANNMINKFYHPNTIENLLKYERMLFPQTQFSYHINTMLFGKKDSAFFWRNENKKIELPKNYNFIIANSLTPTPSFYLSGQRQNKRLAECGIGICMMMKKLEMKEYTKVKNLNDLQELLGYGSEEMILLLKDSVEEKNYKTEEIEKIFGNEIITLIADIPYANNVIQSNKDYNPYGRCLHIFTENLRIESLIESSLNKTEISEEVQAEELAKIFNESFQSQKDNFDCITEEILNLRKLMMSYGVLGCRLANDGWGGSLIGISLSTKTNKIIEFLMNDYYLDPQKKVYVNDDLNMLVFQTRSGASIKCVDPKFEIWF